MISWPELTFPPINLYNVWKYEEMLLLPEKDAKVDVCNRYIPLVQQRREKAMLQTVQFPKQN